MSYNNYEFKECETCASKPGSPFLCQSCLHNRTIVERLKDIISKKNKILVALENILKLDS